MNTTSSSQRRRRSARNPVFSPWSVVISAFAMLCLILGGSSSGGLVANAVLQLIATLLLAFVVTQLRMKQLSRQAKLLLAIVICWIGWCAVQLVPLPPALWTLAPGRELLEQRLLAAGLPLPWLPLTLSVEGTIRHLISLMPPLAIGAAILSRPPEDSDGLRLVIPFAAIISLLIGVSQLLGGSESRLYWYPTSNLGMPIGLMANANHQATLMLCAIPFVASLAGSDAARSTRTKGRDLLLAATVVMLLIGVAISDSYAAYILTLPVVVASWLIARPRSLGRTRYVAIGMVLLTIAAIAVVLIAGPDMLDSHVARGEGRLSRPVMYAVATKAMLHFFPLGSGFGSFVPTYKLFEDPASIIDVFANHSHSDYLELVLEGGLPALVLIVCLLLWWCRQAVTIWFARTPSRINRAAVVATAAIFAHSAVDYPARTSAIAIILSSGLALMAPRKIKALQGEESSGSGRHLTAE